MPRWAMHTIIGFGILSVGLVAAGLFDVFIVHMFQPPVILVVFLHGAFLMLFAVENWGLLRELEQSKPLKDKCKVQQEIICQMMTTDRLVATIPRRHSAPARGSTIMQHSAYMYMI